MFSQRRSYLFLGSIMATMIQCMALFVLFSWFSGSAIGIGYILMTLLLACMYIIYDT